MNILGTNRPEGLLKKPQPLVDLFSGRFVGYQGQRRGTLEGRIVAYVKKPNDNAVHELVDIPESSLRHTDPVNSHSPPEGTWVLLGGPEGIPTLAESVLQLRSDMFQRISEANKKMQLAEAKLKIADKFQYRTQEEHVDEIAKQSEKLQKATRPAFDFQKKRGAENIT